MNLCLEDLAVPQQIHLNRISLKPGITFITPAAGMICRLSYIRIIITWKHCYSCYYNCTGNQNSQDFENGCQVSGKNEDVKEYDNDIKIFTNALQKYSWDESSGYFGYVVHDKNGNPLHILKYNDKVNYDMTFDGGYPLIAGICTKEQKQKIIASLKSDKHIWSNAGLSAVDQSAPYYKSGRLLEWNCLDGSSMVLLENDA